MRSRTLHARRRLELIALLLVVLAGAGLLGGAHASAAAAPKVIVSLTIDDGFASAWGVRPELHKYGMHATFFINSGKLDQPERLTTAQVRSLAAAGDEIGGHSVTHPNLANLDAPEAKRQICNDRVALAGILGAPPTDFAYPYGAATPVTQAIVAACGYNSARDVGGLASQSCGLACSYAESIPPARPYAISSGVSVVPTTSPSAPEGQVQAALAHGGGWLVFVFHAYCDGCSGIAVNPKTFDHLLAWLKSMQGKGVAVATVRQVVGGPVRPLVIGPAPRADTALLNPSLQTPGLGDVPPDNEQSFCWEQAAYGDNTATYARVSDGHGGGWADQITVSHYNSGDAKVLVRQDLGTCSIPVTRGQRLTLSAWVNSTARTRLVVFYREPSGAWLYAAGTPSASADPGWHKLSWTTPPLPATAVRMSFGVAVTSVGTAAVDDFAVASPTASNTIAESNQARLIAIGGMVIVAVGIVLLWHRGRRRPHHAGRSGHTPSGPSGA